MKKIFAFTVSICYLFVLGSQAHAQGLVINELGAQELSLQVPNGDLLVLSTPDLTVSQFTIGFDTRLFEVSSGDFLSEDTIDSFVLLESNSANPTSSLSNLSLGTSFIGFSSIDVAGAFDSRRTIGWAQVLRTSETLSVLGSDSVFSTSPSSSFGILVPSSVPEPTAVLFGAFGLAALSFARRRSP